MRAKTTTYSQPKEFHYEAFDMLNGNHPWHQLMPDACVLYRVRELQSGKIGYFNYPLAKEMGLIPSHHKHEMNDSLATKLREIFSLQIINEYDEIKKKKIPEHLIKSNKYMASRYLQLQHPDRQGKTSGDGRGIWNGVIEHRGRTWDVSSRGTGVTCLAPGSVEANRPLRTGGEEYGYGCGLAEIDELYAAAISSEVLHLQGVQTERVLCVIDLGKGHGIGVRAGENLIRPAHFFRMLKLGRHTELRKALDYLIDRQQKNSQWKISPRSPNRYKEMGRVLAGSFARFAATLEIDYIFAWLDWDGDNVLATAGIIDYGSVRQFGLCHDRYRYDDVDRFSTSLSEQKRKARLIVQVYAQMLDFAESGKKQNLNTFRHHKMTKEFEGQFRVHRMDRLLYRMGFNAAQRESIAKHPELFESFYRVFSYFERAKVSGKMKTVADGVNHPALFNMRAILRFLPKYFLENGKDATLPEQEFFKVILSRFATSRDTKMRAKHRGHIQSFLRLYKNLYEVAVNSAVWSPAYRGICRRADKLNSEQRITGNGLIEVVYEILEQQQRGLAISEVQKMIDHLILTHLDYPEVSVGHYYSRKPTLLRRPDVYSKIMQHLQAHIEDI